MDTRPFVNACEVVADAGPPPAHQIAHHASVATFGRRSAMSAIRTAQVAGAHDIGAELRPRLIAVREDLRHTVKSRGS